jgi:DNA-binding GntR family transcriptional regulator
MKREIIEIIRKRIVTLEYRPGHLLNEQKLADEFGVSRTPVREALIVLSTEGLVTMAPRTMTSVAEINIQKFRELTELRLILEQGAARLAVNNRTDEHLLRLEELEGKINSADSDDIRQMMIYDTEFHQIMSSAANNLMLSKKLTEVTNQFTRIMYLLELKPTLITLDMPKIIEALKFRRAEDMEKLLIAHVNYFMGLVRQKFEQGMGL